MSSSRVSTTNETNPIDSDDANLYRVQTKAAGPAGRLPLEADQLRQSPSGDIFGWTQNVGMGWNPTLLRGQEFLILSTQGGIRAPDGRPIALGYHTGHWEVGLLMEAAAEEFTRQIHPAGSDPVCRLCQRSVRWANPGHVRYDG
jgi:hypothetical protein